MAERLWKIYRFRELDYERAAPQRAKINAVMKRAADLVKEACTHEKVQKLDLAMRCFADSFSLSEQGLHLQDKLLTPFCYDNSVVDGNLALNEGIAVLQTLLIGTGGTAFSNANSYLGVGDSSTAASATQTGLQAATNKLYMAMDTSFPSISAQTITWQSTYAPGDANFAWNEFTVGNGSSDASANLNRKVSSQGTKASGQVWTLQLAITTS